MNRYASTPPTPTWTRATFPSHGMRNVFLAEIRLWNDLEDLPEIWIEPLSDGRGVRFRCARPQGRRGLGRLIGAYGGRIVAPAARVIPLAAH